MVYLRGIAYFIFYVGGQYLIELGTGIGRMLRHMLPKWLTIALVLWAVIMFMPDTVSQFYAYADKNYPRLGYFLREADSFLANKIFQGPLSKAYKSPVRHYEFVTKEREGYNSYISATYQAAEFSFAEREGFRVPRVIETSGENAKWKFVQLPASAYFPAHKNRDASAIKAIYLSGGSATRKRLPDFVRYAQRQRINGVVFDIKDVYGFVNYPSAIPEVRKTQGKTPPPIRNLRETISYLHKNGLYAIARVTLFQDELFAKHYPSARIELRQGGPLLTKGRAIWVDPNKSIVRNYNLGIIRETLQAGADEIQLDYVRYPAEGDWKLAKHFGIDTHEEKPLVITSYLQQVHTLTKSYGARLSLDVFGVVAWQEPLDIKSTGQNMKLLGQSADVLSPMLYPSHFGNSFAGINKPADKPLHFIQEGCVKLKEIVPSHVVIRPWLQAFSWRVSNYTPAYITAQINGAKNAGVYGYLLWNAGNIYTAYSDPMGIKKSDQD